MAKVVLITGSAKRIGLIMARFLAKSGYDIAMHCHSSINIAMAEAQKIRDEFSVRCEVFVEDLSKPENAQTLFCDVISRFGRVDILVNNASVFQKSEFIHTDIDEIMYNFNIHYFSPMVISRNFANQKTGGLIINMLDTNTTRNQTAYFAYLHSKKALHELTKHLAVILAPEIRTNSISPGFIIEEEGTIADTAYLSRKLSHIPTKTKGSPAQIIQAVEYIIQNEYVNGQNLFVDGGAFLLNANS